MDSHLTIQLHSYKQFFFCMKLIRILWGFWAGKTFCPWFLIRNTSPTTMMFPEFQRADSNKY